jgi:chitin synthase
MISQRSGGYGRGELEMSMLELPTDDAILAEIREILRTADLMTVTKKSIKTELETRFGMILDAKRAYINSGMLIPRYLLTNLYHSLTYLCE